MHDEKFPLCSHIRQKRIKDESYADGSIEASRFPGSGSRRSECIISELREKGLISFYYNCDSSRFDRLISFSKYQNIRPHEGCSKTMTLAVYINMYGNLQKTKSCSPGEIFWLARTESESNLQYVFLSVALISIRTVAVRSLATESISSKTYPETLWGSFIRRKELNVAGTSQTVWNCPSEL